MVLASNPSIIQEVLERAAYAQPKAMQERRDRSWIVRSINRQDPRLAAASPLSLKILYFLDQSLLKWEERASNLRLEFTPRCLSMVSRCSW